MLDLEVNYFSGELFFPELENAFDALVYLRGSDNSFTGSIPMSVSYLTVLKQFWAAGNYLTGSIPDALAHMTRLGMQSLRVLCAPRIFMSILVSIFPF